MNNPLKIIMKKEDLTLECIQQFYVAMLDDNAKYSMLKDLFSLISVSQCIIYCNSVKRVIDLHEAMVEDEFPVCCIHSNMEKNQREEAFMEFRNGKSRVLISSNVTARGIDIQQVSVVINFDIPKCVHTYLHRIGRSGRWGRKGIGINLITRRDVPKLREIEGFYSCQIDELPSNFSSIL
jgi:translation initiation factor 4A